MKYYFFLFVLCVIGSCTTTSKLLCKTWKIDDVQFIDSLNTFTKAQKELVTKSLKNDLIFTFNPDSSYLVRNAGTMTNSKWWFTENKKSNTLFTQGADGKIVKSKIFKLSKTYLQFESEGQLNQSFLFICSPVTGSK